jgi:hypothetical protein
MWITFTFKNWTYMSYIFHKRGTSPLPCHLNEFIITEQEILDQLKILNVNKPAGPDGVSPRLLKDIAYSISLVKFDMDLVILHHFPEGISLFKSSEVSLFLYSSFVSLTKSITSFLISLNCLF